LFKVNTPKSVEENQTRHAGNNTGKKTNTEKKMKGTGLWPQKNEPERAWGQKKNPSTEHESRGKAYQHEKALTSFLNGNRARMKTV